MSDYLEKLINPPWLAPDLRDSYNPEPAGRRVVQLDERATGLLAAVHQGKHNKKKAYVLINFEGDLRRISPQVVDDWEEALRVALTENLLIYNPRSKKASRPVWMVPWQARQLTNMTYEQVRLLPHEKTYWETLPQVNAKLFDIEP